MIARHIEYFLEKGAEDVLGIGADLGGMDNFTFIDTNCYPCIARILKKILKLDDALIEKIMYRNLLDFTLKML